MKSDGILRNEWPLDRLMSEVVGAGPKSATDMTRAQASEAFDQILDGEPDPTTLGAFWLANRWKSNTPTELAAFLDQMRKRSVITAEPTVDPLDCGANYDGKSRTAILGVAAGLVAAAAGTPVVVHSADRVPTTYGACYKHVLDALGVETDLSPQSSAAMVDAVGFGFYDARTMNPGVHNMLDRRRQMGVRTFLNTIECLANPANASSHLGSFYHFAFAKRIIETLAKSQTMHFERVLMVQGLEGYDDLRPGFPTIAAWDGEEIEEIEVETTTYGLEADETVLEVDDIATDSAELTETVLSGEAKPPFRAAVLLNAGIRRFARGDVDTVDEGVQSARTAIENGQAAARLEQLRTVSP